MKVVIVELPAKAKTINKYLGKDYGVYASFGHVRDLTAKDGSVDPDGRFRHALGGRRQVRQAHERHRRGGQGRRAGDPRRPTRTARARRSPGTSTIWSRTRSCSRTSASTGWCSTPSPRTRCRRRCAIRAKSTGRWSTPTGRAAPSTISSASPSCRCFGGSCPPRVQRGRVQSVALRLVCDRELEIEQFVSREYWSIVAHLQDPRPAPGSRPGSSARTARRSAGSTSARATRRTLSSWRSSRAILGRVGPGRSRSSAIPTRPSPPRPCSRRPRASSALRRRARRRSPSGCMRGSHRRGPVGLITYMRTDGVDLAPEAMAAARKLIATDFGDAYVPSAPRKYTAKAKNAQEAHEAIGPTEMVRRPKGRRGASRSRPVEALRADLERHDREPDGERRTRTHDRRHPRRGGCSGSSISAPPGRSSASTAFSGFIRRAETTRTTRSWARLPPMSQASHRPRSGSTPTQHFTEPPPRYTEATLIKRMEELGIGLPSTYLRLWPCWATATTCGSTRSAVPEDKGRLVTAFLESFFADTSNTTSPPASKSVSTRSPTPEIDWKELLRAFWRDFPAPLGDIKDLRTGAGARQPQRPFRAGHLSRPCRRRRSAPSARSAARGSFR